MGSNDVVRVGIVGVGIMGADHAERLARRIAGARLVAVADPDEGRARDLAARFEGVRAGADALELIAADDVDAVLLASPGFVHEDQVLACLAADKPVLCEKPLTMDSESSLRLVAADREAEERVGRRLVQVGFMRRFDPEYAGLRTLLESGELGRTLLLHNVHRNASVPNADFRSEMIVRDSLVHEVDVARFLFGEEVVAIQVLSPAPTSHAADGVIDPQVAIFTMAGGGIVTNEVFVNSQVGYEVRCEAVAERGSAVIGRPSSSTYTTALAVDGLGRWGGEVPADYRTRFATAYDLEVQAWVDSVRSGTPVGPTAWDGYAATAVSTAGMASLASGERVDIALADPQTLSHSASSPDTDTSENAPSTKEQP
ncbi:Gfo/Idh/MocA family protein [Knoellia subterranea]|uniref:Inositol 2-dehydrogenase n=1 Tax=Knoellia subterranea KCTC 19937 TaxID=1385521 RepID=A0A0A0JLP9_9MICO|nr:Gfo/Idh/MocA family oxidoreductase [Knoellia subterranea]KGN37694.1 inositol 2-dehydrogenase [Knoellia subterranea KCTC 19937]